MRRLSMAFFAIMLLVAGAAAQDGTVAPLLFPRIAELGRPEWIQPAGLALLTTGQILDKDPLTKVTTTVTHVGPVGERNMVVITEENAIERIEYHYDARSGGLLRLHATNSRFHTDTLFRLKSTR